MNPLDVITLHYRPGSLAYEILVEHSSLVTQKALAVASKLSGLNPDMEFIREAAMLHDIGIFMTDAPLLGCTGELPYICHGYIGRKILEQEGLPVHGLVCERHVGVGITVEDIKTGNLPIPLRDMTPQSIEENIICYADKFFSKNGIMNPIVEKSTDQILKELLPYGQDKAERFLYLRRKLEGTL